MSLFDQFVSIFFKLPDGRSMEEYFKNQLIISEIETADLVTGKTFPASGLLKVMDFDEIIPYIRPTSQIFKDAKAAFNQKANNQTPSNLQYLLIGKKESSETFTEALEKVKKVDGRFAKVVPITTVKAELEEVAEWCLLNKRFTDFMISDVTIVEKLKEQLNNYAYAIFRKPEHATEGIASAIASCATSGYFGGRQGSAQFTQLVGVTPETFTGGEISDMQSANVAFYSNVSPVEGGGTENFGYNWVIGSKMLGGERRQRMMIKDYIEKSLGLMCLEFFNQKPIYDESGNNLLFSMAQNRFKSFQTYELVIQHTNELPGFFLKVQRIRGTKDSIQATDVEAYNAKKYKLSGYYYDAIVGEKVDINLTVDPTEREVEQLLN